MQSALVGCRVRPGFLPIEKGGYQLIKILSITPMYDAEGNLLTNNVGVEILLDSGEIGHATFEMSAEEMDVLDTIAEKIKEKILNGLN